MRAPWKFILLGIAIFSNLNMRAGEKIRGGQGLKNFPRGETTCGIMDVLLGPRAGFLQALSLHLPEGGSAGLPPQLLVGRAVSVV